MTDHYKVFHNPCEQLRKKLHVILVRPEHGGNIGSSARAIKNMGLQGSLIIVGDRAVLNEETKKFAKHAYDLVESAIFLPTLIEAKKLLASVRFIASTARVGSSSRPHPVTVDQAVPAEIEKLKLGQTEGVAFVFGCESDGLSNDEVAICDSVVTIPSSSEYRSINLSQAVLIFAYEANKTLNRSLEKAPIEDMGQRARLIQNLLSLAEEAGFILPNDPHKMLPRLEQIFSTVPMHIPEARTLHGLLDQVRRSLRKGQPDFRGRYRWEMSKKEFQV